MSSTTQGAERVTVQVDGEPVAVDARTTGADLKSAIGAGDGVAMTYHVGGNVRHILDDEQVLTHVSQGAELATWTRRFGPLLVGGRF